MATTTWLACFPRAHQLSVAFAQAHLGLPTDVLDGLGTLLQAQLEMPTDFGGVAIGPGAFDQGTAGMGVARLGDAALTAPLSTGVFRGGQAQVVHQLSGVVEAGEVAEFGHDGDGDGELHAPQGLERLDDRGKPPGLHLLVEFLFQTLRGVRCVR